MDIEAFVSKLLKSYLKKGFFCFFLKTETLSGIFLKKNFDEKEEVKLKSV